MILLDIPMDEEANFYEDCRIIELFRTEDI
jgi:hypothetical protein